MIVTVHLDHISSVNIKFEQSFQMERIVFLKGPNNGKKKLL